jgi:hypothetical protein
MQTLLLRTQWPGLNKKSFINSILYECCWSNLYQKIACDPMFKQKKSFINFFLGRNLFERCWSNL